MTVPHLQDAPRTSSQWPAEDGLAGFLANHGRAAPVEHDSEATSATRFLIGAARQRRLEINRVHRDYHVITSGKQVVGGFTGHLTSLVSDEADRAALSIPTVRGLLNRAGLPVPEGRAFSSDAYDAASSWFAEQNISTVVKPAYSVGGAGITRDVRSREDFSAAWESACAERGEAVGADPSVVVERQYPGFDLRVFVVGEEIIAAAARVPLFCVGDGHRTLRELIDAAARQRAAHPQLGDYSHDALSHARSSNLPLDEVSEADRPYLLGEHPTARAGGVTVDVTGLLNEGLATLAIDAVWAIPGNRVAGVDLLVRGVETSHGALVLDVDSRADFTLHYYPWIGRRRPVAKSLIQQMVASSKL